MALTKIKADGLTADLIDETKLADNSIDSEHYNDGSIDNAHLADDAVGVAELSATGTASSSTFLRGDNSWAAVTSTTINNNADNRVITGSGTANTLEGESDLTFDGTNISIPNGINHTGDTNTAIRFPAADTIAMESAGSEVFRITPDEAHGSSQSIRLKSANTVDGASVQTGGTKAYSSGIPRGQVNIMDNQAYNVTDNGGAIAFGARYNSSDAHTTMASIEGVKHNNDDGNYQGAIAFKTRNNNGDNVIRMRLTDNGLCFGTDTAGANALNDYEEGTWTASVYWNGGNTTGSYAHTTTETGKYTKIGDLCQFTVYLNPGNYNSGSDSVIGGVSPPFTTSTQQGVTPSFYSGQGNYGGWLGSSYNSVFARINANGNFQISVGAQDGGSGYFGHKASTTPASGYISGIYKIT